MGPGAEMSVPPIPVSTGYLIQKFKKLSNETYPHRVMYLKVGRNAAPVHQGRCVFSGLQSVLAASFSLETKTTRLAAQV